MSDGGREMALLEAVKAHWLVVGCDRVVPQGLWWPEVPTGTPLPYAMLDPVAFDRGGRSNRSTYREATLQFRVLDGDAGAALALLDQVMELLESRPMEMAAAGGRLFRLDRGPVHWAKLEEGVFTAWVDYAAGRLLARRP